VIDRPNQVWCADITYIPMRRGFLYLVAIMDWFSRKVLAWRLSNSMDGKGRWIDNRMIERLWRSLKYECIFLHAFEKGSQAKASIAKWLAYYNVERTHSTHGILTPNEVYDSKTKPMRLAA
jgi:putative transposase